MSNLTVLAQPIDTSASLRLIGHQVVQSLDKRLDLWPDWDDFEVVKMVYTVMSMGLDGEILRFWIETSRHPRIVGIRPRVLAAIAAADAALTRGQGRKPRKPRGRR
jgi:hypothetical protein